MIPISLYNDDMQWRRDERDEKNGMNRMREKERKDDYQVKRYNTCEIPQLMRFDVCPLKKRG